MKRLIILGLLISSLLPLRAQRVALSGSISDALELGTIGLEGQVALSRYLTLDLWAKLNPWTFSREDSFNGLYDVPSSEVRDRTQTYSVGLRYWPWNVYSGWWTTLRFQYKEYSVGGIFSDRTEEGDALGGVFGAGYSLMLREHLNLDVGLEAWAGQKTYTKYSCPHCGEVLEEGSKTFLLPSALVLSLMYIF